MSTDNATKNDRFLSDPSALATQQVWREVGSLKELVFSRLEAIETSIRVAHEDLVRVPTDVQKQVGNLKELIDLKFDGVNNLIEQEGQLRDEKFSGVQRQFESNKVAVDAALSAQKEAAGKQEASFSKQIDAQAEIIKTTVSASDGKIEDLKERLTRIEGKGEGRRDFWGWIVAAAALIVSLIIISKYAA
jgi:hypothetical protein